MLEREKTGREGKRGEGERSFACLLALLSLSSTTTTTTKTQRQQKKINKKRTSAPHASKSIQIKPNAANKSKLNNATHNASFAASKSTPQAVQTKNKKCDAKLFHRNHRVNSPHHRRPGDVEDPVDARELLVLVADDVEAIREPGESCLHLGQRHPLSPLRVRSRFEKRFADVLLQELSSVVSRLRRRKDKG